MLENKINLNLFSVVQKLINIPTFTNFLLVLTHPFII